MKDCPGNPLPHPETTTQADEDALVREARERLQTGDLTGARSRYAALTAWRPDSAAYRQGLGVVERRAGELAAAARHFRVAALLDPADQSLREALGLAAARAFSTMHPAEPALLDADGNGSFVYFLAGSHARSFTYSPRLLPFMAGGGNELCFLTEALARRTERQIFAHLDRFDLRYPVILHLGNHNACTHRMNLEKTQELQDQGLLPDDDLLMNEGARRYGDLLARIASRYPGIRLIVIDAYITPEDRENRVLPAASAILRERCAELGFAFVNVNDLLTDPETGRLRVDYGCVPGNMHLSKAVARLVESRLAELGLIPPCEDEHEWRTLIRFPMTGGSETKVWNEPDLNSAPYQKLLLFNHMIERALSHLIARLCLEGPGRVLVVEGGEGGVPLSVPSALCAGITCIDRSAPHVRMGRRLGHFARRDDVAFHLGGLEDLDPRRDRHDHVFMFIPRTDRAGDLDMLFASLYALCAKSLFIVSNIDWSVRNTLDARLETVPLNEAIRSGSWATANLLIASRPGA